MSRATMKEIKILSGEEGRFLERLEQSSEWTPFNYYKYRALFEESQLVEPDYDTLRKSFGLRRSKIPDEDLVQMSPEELDAYSAAGA